MPCKCIHTYFFFNKESQWKSRTSILYKKSLITRSAKPMKFNETDVNEYLHKLQKMFEINKMNVEYNENILKIKVKLSVI